MLFKRLLKRMLPETVLGRLLGKPDSPSTERLDYVWEGIYAHRRDVPSSNYDVSARVREMVDHVRQEQVAVSEGRQTYDPWHEAIGILVADVLQRKGRACILDFGGGVGQTFVRLLGALPSSTGVEYHVVELPEMAATGRDLMVDDRRISFHTTIPERIRPDIVYVSGVLAYLDDYSSVLRKLSEQSPQYVLLARLAAGAFPTFAAKQLNLPGQTMASWLFNVGELQEIMDSQGYDLAYQGLAGPAYNQANYPESHRFGHMRVLLFTRRQPA